jgi:arylsulfatase A-like enzyme
VSAVAARSGELPAKRALLKILACLAALLLAAGCSGTDNTQEKAASSEGETTSTTQPDTTGGDTEAATERPNILFVLTDDLDYASAQKMPRIGALLREGGITFENAFVSHPICCPSRATALTGLYDHNHDVRGNSPPDGGFEKFLSEGHEESSIAASLQEGGYQTAFFGKYLNGYGAEDQEYVPPGWDEWYGKLQEQKLYDYEINENGEVVSYGSEEEDFFTDVLSEKATDFVRQAAPEDQPFFTYVAPTAPHGPATPAERHEGAFADEEVPRPPSFDEEDISDKPSPVGDAAPISEEEASNIDDYYRQRLESMLAVDEMVGALVEELEAAGELDNTYIFFTSDNGWFNGEHRIQSAKNRAYEESARVPLFVRGPGSLAGSSTEKLVVNTDFASTFADLAGIEFLADGRSMAPLLDGEDAPWRSSVLLERLPADESAEGKGKGKGKGKSKDKTGKGKENKTEAGGVPKAGPGNPGSFRAVRTKTHKYVEYDNGDKELYDLQNDPYELKNVYKTADPSLIEDLEAKLEALKECSDDKCRQAEDAS